MKDIEAEIDTKSVYPRGQHFARICGAAKETTSKLVSKLTTSLAKENHKKAAPTALLTPHRLSPELYHLRRIGASHPEKKAARQQLDEIHPTVITALTTNLDWTKKRPLDLYGSRNSREAHYGCPEDLKEYSTTFSAN